MSVLAGVVVISKASGFIRRLLKTPASGSGADSAQPAKAVSAVSQLSSAGAPAGLATLSGTKSHGKRLSRPAGSQAVSYNLSHARHDSAHCLAPGLFRSLSKTDRKHYRLDVTYRYGKGKQLEIRGPYLLGVDDLRVLQGLVALAGPLGLILTSQPDEGEGLELRKALEPEWDAVHRDVIAIRSSYRELAKEIGYSGDSGKIFRLIRTSIERLWTVSIIAQDGSRRQGFKLLSSYASDSVGGRLRVALNPLLTEAITNGGKHVRIDMAEVRRLKGDVARLIHQRLCGWIDPSCSGRVSVDKLAGYVWPRAAEGATMRKRKQRVKEALAEFVEAGWVVNMYSRDKYLIMRPGVHG